MRLLKEQGINVKVTLQPHPYPKGGVQGEKGVNKSFILLTEWSLWDRAKGIGCHDLSLFFSFWYLDCGI